jgi:hypothetical protein
MISGAISASLQSSVPNHERFVMRCIAAVLILAAALAGIGSARAENRVFIIANNADGYGVDRCLATGASCGAAVARAYCQKRDFAEAASFHKVGRDEMTGAVPTRSLACAGNSCGEFVAIECSR